MYLPNYTKLENDRISLDLIEEYPMGLLISANRMGQIDSSYLPFFSEVRNGITYLITHMARGNPQWQSLKGNITVSFLGPNLYISPSFYVKPLNVPTWNYCAVQAHGTYVDCTISVNELLLKTVQHFESLNGTSWSYELPDDFKSKLEAAIVSVIIRIDRFDAKFKLSQNRDPQDYSSVVKHLNQTSGESAKTLLRWMNKISNSVFSKD